MGTAIKKVVFFIGDIILLLYSLLKNLSKLGYPPLIRKEKKTKPLFILGNGPSLIHILDEIGDKRGKVDLCVVNSSVISDLFLKLKPEILVWADESYYLNKNKENSEEQRSYEILKTKVDWNLKLYAPNVFPKWFFSEFSCNKNISVIPFNGAHWKNKLSYLDNLKFRLYELGLLAPVSQNVVISSIYCALRLGYKNISLYGVEHSWLRLTEVGDDNICYLVDEHYYGKEFRPWITSSGVYIKLHELLQMWVYAFSAYHELNSYANFVGAKIINKTKGSFIDAFDREV